MIESKLVLLRKKIRINKKHVIDTLQENPIAEICFICGTSQNLTKEHVIPKWAFKKNQNKVSSTEVNGLSLTYSKAVIPACFECNSVILGTLEQFVEQHLHQTDSKLIHYSQNTLEKIILWLEIIDYKIQILNLRRTFKNNKNSSYIPHLDPFPESRSHALENTPRKTFSLLRNALKDIGTKSKKINSLVMFKTKDDGFHFFHQTREFIFIELPSHKTSLFYFIHDQFETTKKARTAALKIIKEIY